MMSPLHTKYVCTVCGYVYDPQVGDPKSGVTPPKPFAELPEEWICPVCGVGKDLFNILTPGPRVND